MIGDEGNDTMGEVPVPVASVITVVSAALLALVTIFGNLLVITAFLRNKTLQSVANGFLVSLACADLLVGVVVIPIHVGLHFDTFMLWVISGPFCYVSMTVEFSTCASSLLHLCVISVDRYIAIVHPVTYPARMSRKTSLVIIGALWLLSTGGSISIVIYQRALSGSETCLFLVRSFVNIVPSLIIFFLPATVMGILYTKMFLAARAHLGRVQRGRMALSCNTDQDTMRIHRGGIASSVPSKVSNSKWRAVKTVGLVIGALLICWLPVNIVIMISLRCTLTCARLYQQLIWLGFANSAINPVIYAFTNSSFKMAFMKILHCGRNTNSRRSAGNHHTKTLEMSSTNFPCAYPLQHRYF